MKIALGNSRASLLFVAAAIINIVSPQDSLADNDKKIFYVSRGVIEKLTGCEWWLPCPRITKISVSGYSVGITGPKKGLYSVWRTNSRGEFEVYHPLFSWFEYAPPIQSKNVTILRRTFSTSFEDITSYEARHLSSRRLKSTWGIRWGMDFAEVRKILIKEKQFQPINFEEFLAKSKWYMPEWESIYNRSTHTSYSWSRESDLNTSFYLLSRSDERAILILVFDAKDGLKAIIENHDDGRMIVSRNEADRVIRTEDLDFSMSVEDLGRVSLNWGMGPWLHCLSEPNLEELKETESRTRSRRSFRYLIDPARFFQYEGFAFRSWFDRDSHSYETNYSWGSKNKKYYACIESLWGAGFPRFNMPTWQVLEYTNDHLTGIYEYDEYWMLTEYRPPRSFKDALPWIIVGVILIAGGGGCVLLFLARRRRMNRLFIKHIRGEEKQTGALVRTPKSDLPERRK